MSESDSSEELLEAADPPPGEPSSSQSARKLHPAAIPLWVGKNLRAMITTLIPFLFAQRAIRELGPVAWLFLAPFAFGLIQVFFRYFRFRYWFSGDSLIIDDGGLFGRSRKVIPLQRIQSADTIEKIAHRMFGVVELRLEVAGGRSPEAEAPLVALKPDEADRIRKIVVTGVRVHEDGAEAPPPLVRLRPKDLLLAGLTGGRVPVLALLLVQIDEFLPSEDVLATVARDASSRMGMAIWMAAVIAGFAIVVVATILSLLMTVLVYWNFTVRRDGDRLIITRGLLDSRESVVPLRRVQAIKVDANPVRRLFGLAAVYMTVAGYSPQRNEAERTNLLLPLATRRKALEVVRAALDVPEVLEPERLSRPGRKALIHLALIPGVALAVGVVAGIFVFVPWWATALVVAILALVALASYRALGFESLQQHMVVRSGWLVRRLRIVPLSNVQHLSLQISPIQRALGLASVRLHVPKASATVRDLDFGVALAEHRALAEQMTPP